jgi:aminoglycoside 3-N-acetyltransferase
MWSREELASDVRALGVADGDVVMLHASVRSVGEVAGGPDQIHLAVRDALGAAGTLMMYVGCPSYYDDVGRGVLTTEQEREVLKKHPPFDPLTTRAARSHGILAEFFRTYPGSIVNHHITRFAAAGAQASHLLSEHPWDFAYGTDSPLDRFRRLDGKILLLGSGHDEVTFLHHVEHMVDFPDKKITCFKVPYDRDGSIEWRTVKEVDSNVAHANWPEAFFAQIVDGYLERADNRGGRVGNATGYLISAQGLYNFAGPLMQATARKLPTSLDR